MGGSSSLMPFEVHELEARGGLEHLKRAAFDLAADEQHVELAQRVTGVVQFQIVFGSEESLAAGLGADRA